MENNNNKATLALAKFSALVSAKASADERKAAYSAYLAACETPRTFSATRNNGRKFRVRWNGNGNYSDID